MHSHISAGRATRRALPRFVAEREMSTIYGRHAFV